MRLLSQALTRYCVTGSHGYCCTRASKQLRIIIADSDYYRTVRTDSKMNSKFVKVITIRNTITGAQNGDDPGT